MRENAFIGRVKKPTSADVSVALGPSKALWDNLIADVKNECKIDGQEWKTYSPKVGWSLRLMRKKRNILYLAPSHGCFRVSFILGDKAIKVARTSGLPARAIKMIDNATRYPEGTAIRIDVKNVKDVDLIKQFALIKVEN
jgi:hypothetical protein